MAKNSKIKNSKKIKIQKNALFFLQNSIFEIWKKLSAYESFFYISKLLYKKLNIK